MNGGKLTFNLSTIPNMEWGSDENAFPYSLSNGILSD